VGSENSKKYYVAIPTSVVILKHSFTKRLQAWCVSNDKISLNLTNDCIQMFWHGIGGAILLPKDKPKSVHQSSYLVHELETDIVFLDIGSNDLCNVKVSVDQYISGLFTFIQSLLDKGYKKLFCMKFWRQVISEGSQLNWL